jgi:hypothetical protein
MQIAPRLIALLLFTLLALGSSARADDDNATLKHVREAFVAGMANVAAAPFAPAGGDSEALQRYPLYPYLQAARLNRQLALMRTLAAQPGGDPRLPLDDEVAAFLAQQGDRPVTRTLRSTSPRDRPGRRTLGNTARTATHRPRCAAIGSPRASPWARPLGWLKI